MGSTIDSDGLEISPEQAVKAVADGAQLVDVRESGEWEAGRIDGAVHIPLGDLSGRATEIDAGRPVVFQCRVGGRSLMAAEAFRASGVEAYSMAGGLVRWAQEGRPLTPEDGTVADH